MKRNRLLLTLPLIFLLSSCGNDVVSSSSSDYPSTTEIGSTTTSSSDEKIPHSITHDVSDDYHTCQAINNEINMGIRFPV